MLPSRSLGHLACSLPINNSRSWSLLLSQELHPPPHPPLSLLPSLYWKLADSLYMTAMNVPSSWAHLQCNPIIHCRDTDTSWESVSVFRAQTGSRGREFSCKWDLKSHFHCALCWALGVMVGWTFLLRAFSLVQTLHFKENSTTWALV